MAQRGRLYIVNPDCGVPIHFEADVLSAAGMRPAAFMACLALPTLAALAPEDFSVELCDERISPADLDHPAEFVWLTCNSRQYPRMRVLCEEFRRRGKVVAVGGPFPSLTPEAVRPHCDILFAGELEEAAAELFSDLRRGQWKEEYHGPAADMERSPRPRWDLYPNDRSMIGALQTSRGCPYDCSFCEVIQYYGRKPRYKAVAQILAELDALYEHGYRSVFLTDDNLAAIPKRAKEVLAAIAHWNERRSGDRVQFYTQMTLMAAKDPELMDLCARSGLLHFYVGVESPDEASLKEASKRPNLHGDIASSIRAFYERGVSVIASMIVGFDADGPDVFGRYERFLSEVPVPLTQVGPLVLTKGTPLYETMKRAGRLQADGLISGLPYITNLRPKRMSREDLLENLGELSRRLYEPAAFAARLDGLLRKVGAARAAYPEVPGERARHSANRDGWTLVERGLAGEPPLAKVFADARRRRPEQAAWLFNQLFEFFQMRHVFAAARV